MLILTQSIFRTTSRNRRSKELPKASVNHGRHGRHLSDLLDDLDNHSPCGITPLTVVASNDNFLLDSSPDTSVEIFAQSLSWNDAAYISDSSTYLIGKLQAIYSASPDSSCAWYNSDESCQRLKNELFLTNLLYLLRRLQG